MAKIFHVCVRACDGLEIQVLEYGNGFKNRKITCSETQGYKGQIRGEQEGK